MREGSADEFLGPNSLWDNELKRWIDQVPVVCGVAGSRVLAPEGDDPQTYLCPDSGSGYSPTVRPRAVLHATKAQRRDVAGSYVGKYDIPAPVRQKAPPRLRGPPMRDRATRVNFTPRTVFLSCLAVASLARQHGLRGELC